MFIASTIVPRRIARVALAGGLLFLSLPGCSHPPAGSIPDSDVWDVIQIKGQRVGHGQIVVENDKMDGRDVLKIRQVTSMNINRFGDASSFHIEYRDTETPDGALIDFEMKIEQGGEPMRTVGKVVNGRLELQLESKAQNQNQVLHWQADAGGMLAPELSLRRQPMKPGEHRELHHLYMNQLCKTELTATQTDPVALLTGTFPLLKIDMVQRVTTDAEGKPMELKSSVWTDSSGEVVKSWTGTMDMDMEMYRVPRAVAESKTPPATLDLGTTTAVKVDRAVPHIHDTKWVRYRIHLDGDDPMSVFPAGPSQQLKRIDEHTAELTVRAVRPGDKPSPPAPLPLTGEGSRRSSPLTGEKSNEPTDADRKPNNFIQSDDPLIVANAKEAAGKETDPWKTVVALEDFVHKAVTTKDYSQAMLTASDVARGHEGDCKAHAFYLAALARSLGIPARVAVGLVDTSQSHAFAFHMWTEVYIEGRWIGVDATLAKRGIGGGHIKVTHTAMAGADAYSSFLPVAQVVGRLKVEVLDWE